ncbi:MAG: Glucose-6-phosphate isomerase [Gemmatimonadetes bacterium]|jgi:glucose-6-phosphate isomerase|nr:Glucose-6-phosphate isomerase [Gemmatimonadota bacterium]
MPLRLDYTNMMAPSIPGGITDAEWREAAARFTAAHAAVAEQHRAGTLGFLDLPGDRALHQQTLNYVQGCRERGSYPTDVVVLGIGGSALGPIALRTALRPPQWNLLDDAAREGNPRLHVLDNVDPANIVALLARLDLRRSLFIVTSKSGGTAETMSQYLVVRARLAEALGDAAARQQIVFVTDPAKGALRTIARAEGIPALDIPSNVGGRFSVLTPVGVLPAALVGIDTAALLAGAADMRERCASPALAGNIAGAFATLQFLADTAHGRHVQVLMPYSDALRDMADWFVQLWAESLGKHRSAGDAGVGPTPLAALGATDQHSQVQLFMEGPADKTVTFMSVEQGAYDVEIPTMHQDVPELAYLGGHRLGELLDIERRATAGALARRGRPNMTLSLARVDAFAVGGIFMFLELATAYAGHLYGVNAFDQPGVELGKQFTYAMLGRADADAARKEWDQLPKPDPARII